MSRFDDACLTARFPDFEPCSRTAQGCRRGPAADPQLWPEASWRAHCYGCLADLGAGAAEGPDDPKPSHPGKPKLEDGAPAAADGPSEVVVACPHCRCVFCFDCDAYIHESLHNCPGCESRGGAAGKGGDAAAEPDDADAPPGAGSSNGQVDGKLMDTG